MSLTVDQLAFLQTAAAAELLALDLPKDDLLAQQALRKRCDIPEAQAVVTIRNLRARAESTGRFPPEWARQMLATDQLLQQASSMHLATYVGRSLVEQSAGEPIVDLCSGLGADAIGIALAGANVTGVDLSAEAILCAEHNATLADIAERCTFTRADVMEFDIPEGAIVHIDPDRRVAGRRTVSLTDCAPSERFLRALTARTAGGAMKLSPAIDPETFDDWPNASVEYISHAGTCRQCLLRWPGEEGARRATALTGELLDPVATSIDAGYDYAPIEAPGEFLIEPGPAVLAADAVDALALEHGLWRIGAELGWLFGDEPVHTPLAHAFRILHEVPGRVKDVRRAVADLDGGIVEVKPRGLRLDTDKLQRTLRGKGDRPLAILWTQLNQRQIAFITERV
jgi:hypothetical protein